MNGFRLVAPGVWQLALLPLDNMNVYLVGDVLVDSGAVLTRRRLLAALRERQIAAHLLTHAHPDHQGASHAVCLERSVPLWCGSGDRDAAQSGDLASLVRHPGSMVGRFANRTAGPGHPVSCALSEGDEVADFRVVETPGHTPGHIGLWRQRDGVLVLGDVLFNRNPVTLRRGLREPFASATWDQDQNRASARKLAGLGPKLVCFGHGSPLADGRRFVEYVAQLPG